MAKTTKTATATAALTAAEVELLLRYAGQCALHGDNAASCGGPDDAENDGAPPTYAMRRRLMPLKRAGLISTRLERTIPGEQVDYVEITFTGRGVAYCAERGVVVPAEVLLPAYGNHEAMNLTNGTVVDVSNLHGRVRPPSGPDPEKAARKVAAAAVAPLKAARLAGAGVPVAAAPPAAAIGDVPLLPASGPARTNACRPYVEARLAVPGGATLAELTTAAGWRAPYELAHLGKTAARLGKSVRHDGAAGAGRRYWLA